MAKHHSDLIMCMKQQGTSIGKLCDKCDGRCVICDSYIRPTKLVRICDECDFGANNNKCLICASNASNEAYYCKSCVTLEKDREGCPKIINLGMAKKDYIFDKKANANNLDRLKDNINKNNGNSGMFG